MALPTTSVSPQSAAGARWRTKRRDHGVLGLKDAQGWKLAEPLRHVGHTLANHVPRVDDGGVAKLEAAELIYLSKNRTQTHK